MNEGAILLTKARSELYHFLGGLYLMEVDEKQLRSLQKMQFPEVAGEEDSDMDLREGFSLLSNYVRNMTPEDLDDLAADFAKVFLAAGDAAGRAAFPYESVYVDKRHQVGGSTEMQMHALYLARGWQANPQMYRTMDDHIGLMLTYMGILCDEIREALEADDAEKAQSIFTEQRKFLKKHLTNWAFSFTSDVVKFSQRDFYKGIAMITNGFLKKETVLLKGGKLWDTV